MIKYGMAVVGVLLVMGILWPVVSGVLGKKPNEATRLVEATERTNNKAESLNRSFTDVNRQHRYGRPTSHQHWYPAPRHRVPRERRQPALHHPKIQTRRAPYQHPRRTPTHIPASMRYGTQWSS